MIRYRDISKTWILVFLLCLFSGKMLPGQGADSTQDGEPYNWTDIREFAIQGKGWKEDVLTYNRLPSTAVDQVREPVWNLSHHTAGMYVRFTTNATDIQAKWSLTDENISMNHFAATGVSGLDLYVRLEDGSWHWAGVGRPGGLENTGSLVEGMTGGNREYLLYLPLYNGIEELKIGIPEGFEIRGVAPDNRRPIVFYGTSITQGGCASRPGMCTTALLGRWFGREIINLGFSGNGRMEPELAHLLAELDPLVYFLDCLPNLKAEEVKERVGPFVAILREAHPETPIVLAEGVTYNDAFLVEKRRLRNSQSRSALREAYETLMEAGYKNLDYQIAEGQLGLDGEGTVDGTHPTDLGFYRQAELYKLILESVLQRIPEEQ